MKPWVKTMHYRIARRSGIKHACNRGVTGKIAYPNENSAEKYLQKRVDLEMYPCPFCKAWHIGHKSKRSWL